VTAAVDTRTILELKPLAGAVGAEVVGADAASLLDESVAAACLEALEAFGVLFFRGLQLDDAAQVAFTRLLGEPVVLPHASGQYPEIFEVTLDPQKNRAAEYLQSTFFWHIDGATDEIPTRATLLSARVVADEGGDTEFASTYAAFEALPADQQAQLCELRVVHSFEASQRLLFPNPSQEQIANWRRRGEREHPLVWRHTSGRRSLVLGATAERVLCMRPETGRALLDRLLEWATQPKFVYRHRWQVGDLVIWDNRGTMHRALPYAPTSNRTMHRTALVGDEPIA
jgi:alpha-ketoglutarate-dependent taurine dioxygenase